jgi:transposase-like protein
VAQINITLNQEEILQLMQNDREGAFKKLLQESLNSFMKAESTEQLNAQPYERSEERTDSRNGFRERSLNTRIGTIILKVPRHRNHSFETVIFDEYTRSEAALISSMMEMVVNGISTRKVSKVVETLCGTSFSKSTVSKICSELDGPIEAFKERPIKGEYPYVTVDATYFKVREDHRIISKALMVAYAVNGEGYREIIGFDVFPNESNDTWTAFFQGLRRRGLSGVKLITSDAHEGIQKAISIVYPEVPWQRCQFHFSRNILSKAPKKYQAGLRYEIQEMFNCTTIEAARARRDEIIRDYRDVADSAMECLDNGFESAMTVMVFSEKLRKIMRTSNHIERLNKELKRRSNVIGIFPNSESLLRLMGAVIIERNELLQQSKRKVIYKPGLQEISQCALQLKRIATEQQQLRSV